MKQPILLILFYFISLTVLAQRPDSVQVNGKWHFVYPIRIQLEPSEEYLLVAGLTGAEFEQYRDWVQAGDARLNLEKDSLISALRRSIIDDKILTVEQYADIREDYNEKQTHMHRCFIRTTNKYSIRRKVRGARRGYHGRPNTKSFNVLRNVNKKDLRKTLLREPDFQYEHLFYEDYAIPPTEKNLPDGNYILYYDDFFSVDDWKKWEQNTKRVAVFFSLKNNLLTGSYQLFSYGGDTLADGTFENGLREGDWKIKRKIYSGLNYREGWCFNRKYLPSEVRKDSLLLQYKYDLLHGESAYFSQYWTDSYEKDWAGQFSNGFPAGEWCHTRMSGLIFKGDIQSISDSKGYPTISYPWTQESKPLSDSIYTFPEFTSPNNYRELWYRETGTCVENSGMASIGTIKDRPLKEFIQSQYAEDKSFIYLPFEHWCEVWNEKTDKRVARFYRDKKWNMVVGSRYFDNGVLFDTCGFNEQGELVHKLFDGSGKLYRTSVLNEKGMPISVVYTTPRKQLMIDGYAVKNGYNGDFYWEGDTVVADKRIFELKWNRKKRLIGENYYDVKLEQFVEKTIDAETGEALLTKLIPYTNEALTKLDSGYENSKNNYYSKAYYLRKRTMKIDAHQKRAAWGELTFVEDNDREKSRVTLLVNGQPYTGELEITIRNRKYDRYKIKRNKLVIELHNKSSYRRKLRLRIKAKAPAIVYNEINTYLPYLFQLKLNATDEYTREEYGYLREDLFRYNYSSGMMKNGVPAGNWSFLSPYKKVLAEVTYDGENSSGVLVDYTTQYADDKYEKAEYANDPLKEQYEPSCKKTMSYVSRKTSIANGHEEGMKVTFNHIGDTITKAWYKNGKLQGNQSYCTYSGDHINTFHIGTFEAGLAEGKHFMVSKSYRTAIGGGKLVIDTISVVNYVNGKREGKAHYIFNRHLSFDLTFAKNLPDTELTVAKYKGDTTEHFTFMNGYVDRMQYYKENTLSYEYKIPEKDSIKLDLSTQYDFDRIPSDDDYENYLYDYDYEPGMFSDEFIKRDETPKQAVFTKFYPNGTIARSGELVMEKKIGSWTYASEDSQTWYTIEYKDSIYIQNSDTFSIIGVQTQLNVDGKRLKKQLVLEEKDFYKCTSDEYYSIREYLVPESVVASEEVANYYDNGALMSKGKLANGLPDGLWQFYNQQGGLTRTGIYKNGKKIGRWLEGDLTTKAYLGDICLDESNPDLDVIISQLERGKKIEVSIYRNGKPVSKQTYESSN